MGEPTTPMKKLERTPYQPHGEAESAHIHLRCGDAARKNHYVKTARKKGKTLAAWMFETCDEASGYEPPKAKDATSNE